MSLSLEEYRKRIDEILEKQLNEIKSKISSIPFLQSDAASDAKSQHAKFSDDVKKLLFDTINSQDVKNDRSHINEMFRMLSPEDKTIASEYLKTNLVNNDISAEIHDHILSAHKEKGFQSNLEKIRKKPIKTFQKSSFI